MTVFTCGTQSAMAGADENQAKWKSTALLVVDMQVVLFPSFLICFLNSCTFDLFTELLLCRWTCYDLITQ